MPSHLKQDKTGRGPILPPSLVRPPSVKMMGGEGYKQLARPVPYPPGRDDEAAPHRRRLSSPSPLPVSRVPGRPHTYGSSLAPVSPPSQLANLLNKAPK